MARARTIKLDSGMMTLVAGLATIAIANVMRRLHQRGVFDDEDIDAILQDVAAGGLGDTSLDAMAKTLAETLRSQFAARAN